MLRLHIEDGDDQWVYGIIINGRSAEAGNAGTGREDVHGHEGPVVRGDHGGWGKEQEMRNRLGVADQLHRQGGDTAVREEGGLQECCWDGEIMRRHLSPGRSGPAPRLPRRHGQHGGECSRDGRVTRRCRVP